MMTCRWISPANPFSSIDSTDRQLLGLGLWFLTPDSTIF